MESRGSRAGGWRWRHEGSQGKDTGRYVSHSGEPVGFHVLEGTVESRVSNKINSSKNEFWLGILERENSNCKGSEAYSSLSG